MLRLNDLRLPLDHSQPALHAAVAARLGIAAAALRRVTVVRRATDARKKSAITLVYSIDAEVADEAAVTAPGIQPPPDTAYRLTTAAPPPRRHRRARSSSAPAPAASFAALVLAQLGLRPLVLERGTRRSASAPPTPGRSGAAPSSQPESNVQFGEGGAGTFSDGKLWSRRQRSAPSGPQACWSRSSAPARRRRS